jgi:hypothetical protein
MPPRRLLAEDSADVARQTRTETREAVHEKACPQLRDYLMDVLRDAEASHLASDEELQAASAWWRGQRRRPDLCDVSLRNPWSRCRPPAGKAPASAGCTLLFRSRQHLRAGRRPAYPADPARQARGICLIRRSRYCRGRPRPQARS